MVNIASVTAGLALGFALFSEHGVRRRLLATNMVLPACGPQEREGLVILPSKGERMRARLDVATQARAINTFYACGLVAIHGAISHAETDEFAFHAERFMEPLLDSRARVRSAARAGAHWKDMSEDLRNEIFLASGEAIRERQAGRLDLLLPHSMPFNSSGFVLNRFASDILRGIFENSRFELKSAHAVVSLPETAAQHWHRDDEPLFGDAYPTGVYAVNMFAALGDVPLEKGPTEYILGSHLATSATVEQILVQPHEAAAFAWPKGSLVLMDYRMAHRGGPNLEVPGSPRTLAMLVFGRAWWRDAVNYMGDNYGGADRGHFGQDAVAADGGGIAIGASRAALSRRLVQRQTTPPERDRAAMFAHCSALWSESWTRRTTRPTDAASASLDL